MYPPTLLFSFHPPPLRCAHPPHHTVTLTASFHGGNPCLCINGLSWAHIHFSHPRSPLLTSRLTLEGDNKLEHSTMSNLMWTVRKSLAAVSSLLIVISYVTCIIIAKKRDTYVGGIAFPYFSDIGRDKPAYYVFASLNTIASVLMFGFMLLQYYYLKAWFSMTGANWQCRGISALVCGLLAPIGSILLSLFTTNEHADLHLYSAYAFFVFILVYCILTITLMATLAKSFEAQKKMMVPRYIVVAMLAVGVVIYLPIGLAVNCSFERLTVQKCLTIESPDFCEDHYMHGNLTNVYDYTNCPETNTMRSSSQFVSIVSIMLFVALHALDPTPDVKTLTPSESSAMMETQTGRL